MGDADFTNSLYNLTINKNKIVFFRSSRLKNKQKLLKKGFTLSELLIAAAILAFAISGMLLLFINCAFLDQANRNKSMAINHAEFVLEDIMEDMKTSDLVSLKSKIDAGDWNWESNTIEVKTSATINDSERIEVTPGAQIDPLEVMVKVFWKDRAQANERNVELKTLITKR